MKARLSCSPSGLVQNSIAEAADRSDPVPAAPVSRHSGASSKKNDTGTPRIVAIACSRLAPTRLVPFSYFWIC